MLILATMAALGVVVTACGDSGSDVGEPTPTSLAAPTTMPAPTTQPPPITAAPTPTTAPLTIGRSATEVMDLYNEAVAAGEWAAVRGLYADTAEFEVTSGEETFLPSVLLVDHQPRTPHDWDGDGLINGFDGLIDDGARVAAHGTTAFVSCSEIDAATVLCEEVWEGHAFESLDRNPNTWTLTIVDGAIAVHALEVALQTDSPVDTDLLAQYHQWVAEGKPELETGLFEDATRLGISPDSVATHRQLVAEWRAQPPEPAGELVDSRTETFTDAGNPCDGSPITADLEEFVYDQGDGTLLIINRAEVSTPTGFEGTGSLWLIVPADDGPPIDSSWFESGENAETGQSYVRYGAFPDPADPSYEEACEG